MEIAFYILYTIPSTMQKHFRLWKSVDVVVCMKAQPLCETLQNRLRYYCFDALSVLLMSKK